MSLSPLFSGLSVKQSATSIWSMMTLTTISGLLLLSFLIYSFGLWLSFCYSYPVSIVLQWSLMDHLSSLFLMFPSSHSFYFARLVSRWWPSPPFQIEWNDDRRITRTWDASEPSKRSQEISESKWRRGGKTYPLQAKSDPYSATGVRDCRYSAHRTPKAQWIQQNILERGEECQESGGKQRDKREFEGSAEQNRTKVPQQYWGERRNSKGQETLDSKRLMTRS